MATTFIDQIRSAVNGRHPLIYLQTPEEERVFQALTELAAAEGDARVSTWTCTNGLQPAAETAADTSNPVAAIQAVIADPHPGFYLLKDITAQMNRPAVVRALRDAYYAFYRDGRTSLVICSPDLSIPSSLEKEICLVNVALPDNRELLAQVLEVQQQYDGEIAAELHPEIVLALKGLTLNEVSHVMHRVFSSGLLEERDILDEIFREKQMLVKKSGFLEFVPLRFSLDDVGGLGALKDWIRKREYLFNQDAVDKGLPVPKGILLMGISGCGKSMAAKVVAAQWKIPLFRLDMNLIHSGVYGSAEAALDRAFTMIESVAPAVLWIDEIENGLGIDSNSASGQSHLFSAFLTWMQEKPPLVFVAATANRIQSLPAEIIRKGRFDQVFFCDLPRVDERADILTIHIRRQGGDPAEFDLKTLVLATEGWGGSELEQAVIAGRIDANEQDRPFTTSDIYRHTRSIVPLSETMAEQIKAIKDWVWGRATSASETRKGRR